MKKQRPHKVRQASKRARKAKPRSADAVMQPGTDAPVSAALQSFSEATAEATAEAAKTDRKGHAAPEAWAWHGAVPRAAGGPSRRAKGPPPKHAAKQQDRQKKVDAKKSAARATKLAPELLAFVDAPPEMPHQPAPARTSGMGGVAVRRWREERVAALVLLVPLLLMAGLLTVGARRTRPPEPTAMVTVQRGPMSAVPASGQAHAVRVSMARTTPPLSRPGDPIMADAPVAERDLDLVSIALAHDASWAVAMAGPPFTRAPERTTPSIPMAVHDLDGVSVALKDDVRRSLALLRLPSTWAQYGRTPEAATETVPAAVHDLEAVAAALARDAIARRVASAVPPPSSHEQPASTTIETPFGRTPEGTLFSALPQAGDRDGEGQAAMCRPTATWQARFAKSLKTSPLAPDGTAAVEPQTFGLELAAAAKAQISDIVIYNAQYMTIAYPRGDVPDQFGVCTDVVIRAYRALGIDLQELVHLSRPGHSDPSIDHRRTELLRQYFATHGQQLPTSPYIEDYMPGDIVTYYRPQNKSSQSHIAIVTDVMARSGRPMIVHNRGWGVQLEDALFVDQMTGHYRFRAPQSAGMLVATAGRDVRNAQIRVKGGHGGSTVQLASAKMMTAGVPRRAAAGAVPGNVERTSACNGATPGGASAKACPAP